MAVEPKKFSCGTLTLNFFPVQSLTARLADFLVGNNKKIFFPSVIFIFFFFSHTKNFIYHLQPLKTVTVTKFHKMKILKDEV